MQQVEQVIPIPGTKVYELVSSIERDDSHTVERILAHRNTGSDILVPYILTLAARQGSREVYSAVAPMLANVVNSQSTYDDYWYTLHNVMFTTLNKDDPVLYEAFFSALDKTIHGARGLLLGRLIGPDLIHDPAWFSHLGVINGRDTGAYAVLKKYLGEGAIPKDPVEAFEQIQTPAMIKYLVETGKYVDVTSEEESWYHPYVRGEMTYEELVKVDEELEEWDTQNIISKILEEQLI